MRTTLLAATIAVVAIVASCSSSTDLATEASLPLGQWGGDSAAMIVGDTADVPYGPVMRPGKHRIIGFEPAQEECDRLNAQKKESETFLPYFIGDGTERTFHECNFPMTSSLYPPNTRLLREFQNLAELTTLVRQHRVKTKRLDDIPEVRPIDLLKIDVQGAELEVFQNAPQTLTDVCVIQTEVEFVPLYVGQPLFSDVDIYLRSQGFLLHTYYTLAGRCFKPLQANNDLNARINQILWTDAIYVRDFTKLDQLFPPMLLKMAVILNDCYHSADLAARILLEYDRQTGTKHWKQFMKVLTGIEPPE